MGVGDGKAVGGVAGDRGLIARNGILLHRIDDGGALFVRIQIGEVALPAVGRVEGERFAGDLLAVGQQPDGDFIRAHAVLVVRVVPDLFHGHGGRLGRVGVGDGKAVYGSGITGHRILGDGVYDLLSVFVFGQTGEAARPVVGRVEGERFAGDLLAVGQQPDGDFIRAHAVLVVRVVPDLFHGKIHKLGIGIGDLDIPYLRRFGIVNDLGDVLPDAGVGKFDLAGRAAVPIDHIRVIVQRCDEQPVVPGYVHGDVIRRVLIGWVYLQAV